MYHKKIVHLITTIFYYFPMDFVIVLSNFCRKNDNS